MAQVEVYKHAEDDFRWRLRDDDGAITAVGGKTAVNPQGARYEVDRFRAVIGLAELVDLTDQRDVIRWERNGDHPDDGVGDETIAPDGSTYKRIEGNVVRFFRHPEFTGGDRHIVCGRKWHEHGWIDEGPGYGVCPGDLVVTTPEGRHFPFRVPDERD